MIMKHVYFNMIRFALAAAFSLSLSACLTQPSREPANIVDDNSDDPVSIKPAVLCGDGRAVVGANSKGDVICGSLAVSGLSAKSGDSGSGKCEEGEIEEIATVETEDGEMLVPTCALPTSNEMDSATFGEGPTEKYSCPEGATLKGFSNNGEPICETLVGEEFVGVSLLTTEDRCPFGMAMGVLMHPEFEADLCNYDERVPRSLKLTEQRVAKFPVQWGKICVGREVVIGFGEDHSIICGKGPLDFKNNPPRYIATKFDGHAEKPICRQGYVQSALILKAKGKGKKNIKVWTCVKDEGL